MKQLLYLLIISLCVVGCVTSRSTVMGEPNVTEMITNSELTIFLLERDIPQNINRLGTISIPLMVNTYTLKQIDADAKKKLNQLCKKAGANGAYRINDGTYSPYVVSYLIFRYAK